MSEISFTVEKPKDGAWGIVTNGSWNGMIGMLQRKVKLENLFFLNCRQLFVL